MTDANTITVYNDVISDDSGDVNDDYFYVTLWVNPTPDIAVELFDDIGQSLEADTLLWDNIAIMNMVSFANTQLNGVALFNVW